MSSITTVSTYVYPGADQFVRQIAGIKVLKDLAHEILVESFKFLSSEDPGKLHENF